MCFLFSSASACKGTNTHNTSSGNSKPNAHTARILFYNVENLFDTVDDPKTLDDDFTPTSEYAYTETRYHEKLNHLAQVIAWASEEAPIMAIGMAEVENIRVVEDLMNNSLINNVKWGVVEYDSPDERGIDVAFVYNKAFLTVESSEKLEVRLKGDKTRDILHVVCLLNNKEKVHFYVNHWSSRREGQELSEPKRIEAANTLVKSINEVKTQDPNSQIIIMGDFNDYPDNKSVNQVLNASLFDEKPNGVFFNTMKPIKEGEIKASHVYKGEWGFLDQIIVSPNLVDGAGFDVINKEGKPFYNEKMIYRDKNGNAMPNKFYVGSRCVGGYSDHFPVYVDLNLP